MPEATKATRGEGLWDLLYSSRLTVVITAESKEKAAIKKFGVWKREMESRD